MQNKLFLAHNFAYNMLVARSSQHITANLRAEYMVPSTTTQENTYEMHPMFSWFSHSLLL